MAALPRSLGRSVLGRARFQRMSTLATRPDETTARFPSLPFLRLEATRTGQHGIEKSHRPDFFPSPQWLSKATMLLLVALRSTGPRRLLDRYTSKLRASVPSIKLGKITVRRDSKEE